MRGSLLFCFLFVTIHLSAQTRYMDSLRKVLPGLAQREQVNCLNALAWEFNFSFIRIDSARLYANEAYAAASVANYKSGQARALLIKGEVEGRLLGHMDSMQRSAEQAIALLKDKNDPANLSTAYYKLAIAQYSQGNYNAALADAATAKQIATDGGDKQELGWALEAAGLIYCHNGEYWKSFENLIISQQIGKELNDSLLIATSLAFIAHSFNRVGDPKRALQYYYESLQYATSFFLLWPHMEDMAYAHLQLNQLDSVLYYQQQYKRNIDRLATDQLVHQRFSTFLFGYSAEVQLARKEYDNVKQALLPKLPDLRKSHDIFPLMQSLLLLAKTCQGSGEINQALLFGRELEHIARVSNNQQFLREASHLMASLFDMLKKADSAFAYYKNYIAIKDAMDTTQFAQRTALYMAALEANSRISLLKKDMRISEQQLLMNKKELARQGQLKNWLVAGLLLLLVVSVLMIRNNVLKRKNDQLEHAQAQLALKRKALELEMQALRAQMNPHFIFNCLNAIDNLMQTNQPDKATSYLARFAGLIRAVLESSKNNLVPFQKDFDTLKLYLELEQFRCNNKFSYSLHADQQLLDGDYKVPPLIIQPFVENAIHHGLLNKQDINRQLKVTIALTEEQIVYVVTDNGIGRRLADIIKQNNKPGQQSYGIAITRERIQLHNMPGRQSDIVITDLYQDNQPAGTKAEVKINSL